MCRAPGAPWQEWLPGVRGPVAEGLPVRSPCRLSLGQTTALAMTAAQRSRKWLENHSHRGGSLNS